MTLSFATKISVQELFGEPACWIVKFLMTCNVLKYTFDGFFMSIYRILCMKISDIGLNINKQRKIIKELIILKCITIIMFHGVYTFGTILRGTSLGLAMLRGHSTTMDDTIGTVPCKGEPHDFCNFPYKIVIFE